MRVSAWLPRLRRGSAPAPALALALLAGLLLTACADGGGAGGLSSPVLARIHARGRLVCGINGQLPGFSSLASDGRYHGLDVEICRALAAAVFADPSRLELRPVTTTERFAALGSGDVDVLSRNTTVSLSRDASGGNALSFAPVVFHDGGALMAPVASGIHGVADLAGKTVCVLSGTSNETVLADRMRLLGLPYTPLHFRGADQTFDAYQAGRCAAVTSDRSGLAARRSRFADPGAHRILPELLSREPLAPATAQSDPAWADAVRWVVYALIEAEERGITQANVKATLAAAKADPARAELRRFLGVEAELGSQLGLANDFVVQVLAAVGHYGEIFERNVGKASPLKIERGANRLFRDGGLMVSPPFR
jgi:general L-amino acid transport system substrate-binding protein